MPQMSPILWVSFLLSISSLLYFLVLGPSQPAFSISSSPIGFSSDKAYSW